MEVTILVVGIVAFMEAYAYNFIAIVILCSLFAVVKDYS
jgi:hypothetical protein